MSSRWIHFGLLVTVLGGGVLTAQDGVIAARDLFLHNTSGDERETEKKANLGVRYTVLLVDPKTDAASPVDPNRVFHKGDCFAVELTSNQSGSILALNHGSSGQWSVLIPNDARHEEGSGVIAGIPQRIPQGHCFQLDDHAGVETLQLAIVKSLQPGGVSAAKTPVADAAEVAANTAKIRQDMESWQRLNARDLRIEKIDAPMSRDERPYTVYAALSSLAPDRLVIQIPIRHD